MAILKCIDEREMTIEVKIKIGESMLNSEENIQAALNKAGCLATGELLKAFDTDGSPIKLGDVKFTSKGKVAKEYQTPYGAEMVERNVYQTSKGGKTYCPLDRNARIVNTATPKFAKMISSKYAEMNGAKRIQNDLEQNHGRHVSKNFIQNTSDAVGSVALLKEESWNYDLPEMNPVKFVTVGVDGTTMFLSTEGYRETMVGTIGFYDENGERMSTIYVGATPEYGKQTFYSRMESRIQQVKERYPRACYVGIADGASSNWGFLNKHTETQTLDFYHASEYLGKTADAAFRKADEKKAWLALACSNLKHKYGAPSRLIKEMNGFMKLKLGADKRKKIEDALKYFRNQKDRMNYARAVEENQPIGSGVTEAACKVIVKQRMCSSGMRWKEKGAGVVMTLRCMNYSENVWEQFWQKINRYGVPALNN